MLPVRYSNGEASIVNSRGELIPLGDVGLMELAEARDELRLLLEDARDARSAVDGEIKNRMGRDTKLDAGSYLIELSRRREWDPDATWRALSELVDKGLVSSLGADEAMPEVTARKPDGRKLTSLLTKLVGDSPVDAVALAQARSETSFVKLKRTSVDSTAEAA